VGFGWFDSAGVGQWDLVVDELGLSEVVDELGLSEGVDELSVSEGADNLLVSSGGVNDWSVNSGVDKVDWAGNSNSQNSGQKNDGLHDEFVG